MSNYTTHSIIPTLCHPEFLPPKIHTWPPQTVTARNTRGRSCENLKIDYWYCLQKSFNFVTNDSSILQLFTARCTLVQSAVLWSHVVCRTRLTVCPFETLLDCDHIGWNSSQIILPLLSLGCSLFADPNIRVYSNTRKFWPKVTHPCPAEWLHTDSATVTMESL